MKYLFIFISLVTVSTQAQTKKEIIQLIETEACELGLDPDLALAIATVESSLNPKAIGSLKERGLFQLRPEFHKLNGTVKNNIRVGIKYLVYIKTKHETRHGDAWFVLYNTGPYSKIKSPTKTAYYKKVTKELNKIKFNRYLARN